VGGIVGIDLGTTNSCVAVIEAGEVKVIHNHLGARTTPSVVALKEDGSVLVGVPARRQAITNPQNTIFGVKRLIGRKFDSPAVAELRRTMPYEIIQAPNGDAWVRAAGRDMSPPEVSAYILRYMKKVAEDYLGQEVTQAIVTVPAYFDDAQRQATKDAGEIADLKVRAILNEPTAAALAYGVHKTAAASTVAVFDLGGGTFDVSILKMEDSVFEVLSTNGDTFLGGDDWDRCIVEALLSQFKTSQGLDLGDDPAILQRLRTAAETAKHELSTALVTEVNLPFLTMGAQGPVHLIQELSRTQLESLSEYLAARLEGPCLQAMEDAHLTPEQIDQVVLVGGMTRMPSIERAVHGIFGKDPSRDVNPDEIVAVGAATQSAIMKGELKALLLDVTSHTLGIRVEADQVEPIIARNVIVPVRETKIFTTTADDQDSATVEVYQGEYPSIQNNRLLGQFVLGDLPKGVAESVKIEVSFTLDADGILAVDARETATGKATSKRILASSGLSREHVKRLASEAQTEDPFSDLSAPARSSSGHE